MNQLTNAFDFSKSSSELHDSVITMQLQSDLLKPVWLRGKECIVSVDLQGLDPKVIEKIHAQLN